MENIVPSIILKDTPIFHVHEEQNLREQCTGKNQKGLLIATNEALNEAQKQLLGKILKAVQYDLANDALLLEQETDAPIQLSTLFNQATVEKVLVFGLSPAKIGLHVNYVPYRAFQLIDKTFLIADSLSAIAEDRQLKSDLWNALKVIFQEPA